MDLIAEAGTAPCDAAGCADHRQIGRIATVTEGSARIRQIAEGEVEIVNLFLVVDGWNPAEPRRITLHVSDACDRGTSVARTFGGG